MTLRLSRERVLRFVLAVGVASVVAGVVAGLLARVAMSVLGAAGGSSMMAVVGSDGPAQEIMTMRAFDCVAPDGSHEEPIHFEAEFDDGIAEQAIAHIAEYHAALGITDEQARSMIAEGAYDLAPA